MIGFYNPSVILTYISLISASFGFSVLLGGGENSVESVHTDAALEAGSGLLAQQTLHLDLVHQVLGGLMQVGETVDLLTGQAGGGGQ